MKKFLFLLLLIAAGAGYYAGSSETSAVRTQGHTGTDAAVVTNGATFWDSLKKDASSAAGALSSGVSSLTGKAPEKTPSPSSVPSPALAEAPLAADNPQLHPAPAGRSMLDEFRDTYEFTQSLEARLNRDRFVPAGEIPDLLKKGIIATEDRRFYDHGAVDLMGVARAALVNYSAGSTVEGGSTIAQQTVKNVFLSNERTMMRKVRELFLAVQLERNYTKEQILEIYLNTIYFGHGAYGVGDAARIYFHKAPKDLTLTECALLSGLPQAPSAYDPIDHPAEAKKRMTTVLMLMAREGYITPQEASHTALSVLMK